MNGPATDISSPRKCSFCGGQLDQERLEGLCPACTWRMLAEAEGGEGPGRVARGIGLLKVPGHVLLEEIARGGMGIVYRARQLEPQREVALKMLPPYQSGSAEMRERFLIEVRAMTGLDHPAILPVYQTGEQDALPFFTMKLARGGSLAKHAPDYAGNWKAVAELVATVAEAVQFAHERGVLHRDLKPGNILFDEARRPYVSDFGLAKLADTEKGLTRSMDFLGTPHYIAPEIANRNAQQATTASDIYSLGAILYEMLAGRPPFDSESIPGLLRKITEEEAQLPSVARIKGETRGASASVARTEVPHDLEVIALKCLAKEPGRRYRTARELQEDLRRWLQGKPIAARPISALERTTKWVRRNPALSAVAGALIVSLGVGGFGLWRSYEKVRLALLETRQAQSVAQQNLSDAFLAEARALGAARVAGQRWRALEVLGRAAGIRPSIDLRNEAAAALARPDLKEASRFQANFGDAGSSVVFTADLGRFVAPIAPGGFGLYASKDQSLLARFATERRAPAKWFVLSPDDRLVAAVLDDYELRISKLEDAQTVASWKGTPQRPPIVAFHPDSKTVAGYVPGEGLFIKDLDGSHRRALESTNARVIYLRFSPDGKRLGVVRDPGGVELWNCEETPSLAWTYTTRRTVPWLAWSPDGSRIVVAADDFRGIRVLDSGTGEIGLAYSRHLLYPRQFEYSPDGRTIASIGQDWTLRLWDAATGQDLVTSVGRHRVMRFSGNGQQLTTAPSDQELALLDLAPAIVFREFQGTPVEALPGGLTESASGRLVMAQDPFIRLYDVDGGLELGSFFAGFGTRAFFGPQNSVFIGRPGKGISRREFALATNETTRTLELTWGAEQLVAPHPEEVVWSAANSGPTWLCRAGSALELWQERDPARARRIGLRTVGRGFAASRDARLAAAADTSAQTIRVWDCAADRSLTNLPAIHPDYVWFSPDGQWLVASVDSGYQTWSTATWQPGAGWPARLDSGDSGRLSFSDDGRLVVARHERETFRLLSFPDCKELVTLKPPLVLAVNECLLSGDGSRLWLLAGGFRLFEWNLAALRGELSKLRLDWERELAATHP